MVKFPGQIRKTEHFIAHIKKFMVFIKKSLAEFKNKSLSHDKIMEKYVDECFMDRLSLPLTYFPLRLRELLVTLRE